MLRLVPVEIDDTAVANTATLAAPPASPRAPNSALPEGLRLGHFRIDKQLGAGGMGEVYLATDIALDRPVAIKVLPSGVTSGSARERLIREARAQARIQHPNVAHIYFIGEEDGRLYFAMEHLAGQTLADRAAAGPLSVEDALAAIRAAALGLREAQRSGFTHRDVKPSNLMSDAHGVLKVLDFGLVAAMPEAASGPVEQTSLAGTPLYMAPEQAKGLAIDLRADIYALGATLFHLVSGRPPFVADSVDELVSMHATALRPGIPRKGHARTEIAAVDRLIARMMAPDPADRFQTYDELLRELDLVSSRHTRPAGAWARSIATAIDFLVVTLLALLVAAPFGGHGDIDGNIGNALILVYGTLTIARWGTTIGKAVLELQVVSIADGGKPSLTQAFVREATLFGPTVVASYAQHLLDMDAIVTLIVFTLTILALFLAAWRVPGKRAPWDRVAGTQVRYRAPRRESAALLP
jgi:serine/threonine-protein kinase